MMLLQRLQAWLTRPTRMTTGIRPTLSGLGFLLGTTLIGLTAVDADVNLLLMLFGLCVGAFLVNFLLGWRCLRFISIRRIAPDAAVVGQQFDLRYVITNKHRWITARALIIEDEAHSSASIPSPQGFITALGPGETQTINIPYLCDYRGRLTFSSFRVMSGFPFNLLVKWRRLIDEREMVIYPMLGSLRADPRTFARALETSSNSSNLGRQRGEEEYFGIREYRHGDSLRKIHWRRSARTGQLMIRETAATATQQYWCVVDSRRIAGDDDPAGHLEQVLSAAATFVCAVLEQGASVGLICNGDPLVILPPGAGRSHRPRLLRELALRAGEHHDGLAPHVRSHPWPARWHGACFYFACAEDDDVNQAVAAIERALGTVRVLIPGARLFDKFIRLPNLNATSERVECPVNAAPVAAKAALL